MKRTALLLLMAAALSSCAVTGIMRDDTDKNGMRTVVGKTREYAVGQGRYGFSVAQRQNILDQGTGQPEWYLYMASEDYIPSPSGLTLIFGNQSTCHLPELDDNPAWQYMTGGNSRYRYSATFSLDRETMDKVRRYGIKKIRIRTGEDHYESEDFISSLSQQILTAREKFSKTNR